MRKFDFNTASPEEVRAEAQRREDQRNGVISYEPRELKRQATVLEKEVQQRVIALYKRAGCTIYTYSQPRKAKYLTPGAADLQIFSPLITAWLTPPNITMDLKIPQRIMWYHESKKPVDGRYSEDQLLFAAFCREAGIDVIGGGIQEAQSQLDRLNIKVKE